MTSVGIFRLHVKAVYFLFVFSTLLRCANFEKIEIVTPENSKTTTTETPTTTTTTTTKTTKKVPLVDWNSNDSYIVAYKQVHKLRLVKRNDGEFNEDKSEQEQSYNTLVRSTYLPDDKYPSLTQDQWTSMQPINPPKAYGPPTPAQMYGQGTPTQTYGTPPQTYGIPSQAHGPSASSHSYGSPTPPNTYGAPPYGHESPNPSHYGAPHYPHHSVPCHDDAPSHKWHSIPYSSSLAASLLLPKKLSIKLLLKIILKLVLFKMIVKFIAVLCLLLFIPTLKAKETGTESDGDERRRMRQLDVLSNFIWDSLTDKHSSYGEEEEMKDIEEIAEQADYEPSFSGPESAVRFLQFCISTVDRVVGLMLGYLRRKRNEKDELLSFLLEKFKFS